MHGLIFETSVWLLAESTRLLSVPRQSAFHWLPTRGNSPERSAEAVPQARCPFVSFHCQASYQQACTMPTPSAGCLFRLPTIDRNYPAATAIHADWAFTHINGHHRHSLFMLHTPDRIGSPSTEVLRALTMQLPSKGSLHRSARSPVPSGCFQHYMELHTVCSTYQPTNNTLCHRDCSLRLCMLLHHWCRRVKHPAGGFTWNAPLLSTSQVLHVRPLSTHLMLVPWCASMLY